MEENGGIVPFLGIYEDGSYISYEFMHHFNQDRFYTYFVKVDLVEMPNGTFRVNGWDPHNTELMEQAYTAMPLG